MGNLPYHIPVLCKESIENLVYDIDGVYIDMTFGGGGHAQEILKRLSPRGRLFAFDQDNDAIEEAQKIEDERLILFKSNFCYFDYFLDFYEIDKVNGIFADLGVSSYQIDSPDKGFSTRFSGPLDMRMNKNSELTAEKIINRYNEQSLERIFRMYGEVVNSKKLASVICTARKIKHISTTDDLCNILRTMTIPHKANKYMAQVFQALRIEVNQELDVLQHSLIKTVERVVEGGRICFISYHSLEDRLVKRFISKGHFEEERQTDIYGNFETPFYPLYKKTIEASSEEIENNSRSRSAKMRVGVRSKIYSR